MKRKRVVLLVIVAAVCFGVALSYPIRYWMAERSTVQTMEQLIALRDAAIKGKQEATAEPNAAETPKANEAEPAGTEEAAEETPAPAEAGTPADTAPATAEAGDSTAQPIPAETVEAGQSAAAEPTREAAAIEASIPESAVETDVPEAAAIDEAPASESTPEPTLSPEPTPVPAPTANRFERLGALSYEQKEKRTLDESQILPQYREIYALNPDFAGWLTIPNTVIDYPVMQNEDNEYYLHHDFFGEENDNGQLILDSNCDPYTPSYNLVISGHNMRSGQMFGGLQQYADRRYWNNNKIVYFDTLMEQKTYVIFAAFYSADYDVDETGFRYNVDIQYRMDTEKWLKEIRENQLYDTEIDVAFGDEFLTLTTCNKQRRKDGRFVLICRRLREEEEF